MKLIEKRYGEMKLEILLPTRILFEGEVNKISAESQYGSFTLLPHHIDYVTALVPGLLYFEQTDHDGEYIAIDEGILVKKGAQVSISIRNAVRGADLGELQQAVRNEFQRLDDREKRARAALVKLEVDFMRRFVEIGEL